VGGKRPGGADKIATRTDIAQVLLLMQAAFPNYHPEPAMLDVLLQFLQDLPGDVLKVAVLASCAQSGRAFAPSVGEIRQAALKLSARAQAIPNEFEAWAELCRMPGDCLQTCIEVDESGNMVTDENGRVVLAKKQLVWSHPLVERTAVLMGWPDFPGENLSVDRAHFYQAYRAGLDQMMEIQGELPAVRKYIEDQRRKAELLDPNRNHE
jgi:hypothetical protein